MRTCSPDALVLGARPNMMISTRESYLLHNAARLGHIECVRELLYAGANPMLLDNNVLPPICYTNGRSIGDLPGVPLTERHLACAIVLLMFAPDCTNEQSVKAGALRVFVCCCRFSLSSFVWRVTDVGFANYASVSVRLIAPFQRVAVQYTQLVAGKTHRQTHRTRGNRSDGDLHDVLAHNVVVVFVLQKKVRNNSAQTSQLAVLVAELRDNLHHLPTSPGSISQLDK
jgi:hypothetical protein